MSKLNEAKARLSERLPESCHQQDGEKDFWYARFIHYLLMGNRRSLLGAYKDHCERNRKKLKTPPVAAPTTWRKQAHTFLWEERAAAFDFDQLEKEFIDWESRRDQLREQDWQQGQAVREKIDEFLAVLPRFIAGGRQMTTDEVGNTHTLEYVKLRTTLKELMAVLSGASKLQRLAANEPTDHIQLSGAALDSAIIRELERLGRSGEAGTFSPAEGTERQD